MTGRSPLVARDNTHNSSSDTAMAANPNPELRKKRKKDNDDNNDENGKNDENDVKKTIKARNRAHLSHQYSVSKSFRQQQLFHEGSDASANYFPNDPPTEERVREGIEKEAQIQHNLSSSIFIEIGDGDEREVLSKDEVDAATDQARRLQEAKGLSEEEHAAFIEELFAFSVNEYEKKENENESESERAEEENGFLFFPNSVNCLLLAAAIVHIFDNYPADNDVNSVTESAMRILQQQGNLGSLGGLPFTHELYGFRTSKNPIFPPEEWAQKTETLLATEATLECWKAFVPKTMVRLQDVAPFCDGTRRKKPKSLGCQPPEIMHEAGVKSFLHHLSSDPSTKTTLNLVRGNNTSEAFLAAIAEEQERKPEKKMKLFKMKENVDENTGKLSTGTGNVGVYILREHGDKDNKYRYTWYFILPSPTLSTKALTVDEQSSALRDTLSVINEFLRLLGAKPWGKSVNPLTLKRGSGNLHRGEEVLMKRY
ncbi:unnamed protein product [Bathycoccus prasinos]